MSIFYGSDSIFGERGPAGPDGTPIGTVISFLGQAPPQDYLTCDGTIYTISEYSDLSEFFRMQFGRSNYFGGNGTTTFAVPDMRNLFLRGYHGSTTVLSGEVGKKQEGTIHPNVQIHGDAIYGSNISNGTAEYARYPIENADSQSTIKAGYYTVSSGPATEKFPATYTSRPVNMAVLYCIKAVESKSIWTNKYSLEETIVGEWIDGKPIYRKTFNAVTPNTSPGLLYSFPNIDMLVGFKGRITGIGGSPQNYLLPSSIFDVGTNENGIIVHYPSTTNNPSMNKDGTFTIEYTKTTD